MSTDRERIADALRVPSYTPARRDLAIVALLVAEGDERAARGLLRAAAGDAVAALERVLDANPDDAGAARLVTALGQVARAAPDQTGIARLVAVVAGAPTRAGRAALLALGKLGGDTARAALIAHADRADLPADHVRALAEALGKVGGADAEARLAAITGDAETARRRDRSLLMVERDRTREEPSRVRGDLAPATDVTYVLRCRHGLEDLLVDELREARLTGVAADSCVRVVGRVPFERFFSARLWLSVGIELPVTEDLPGSIVAAEPLLRGLTEGAIRWRLDFAGGGHRRSLVWRTAQAVRAAAPALVNDPTATTWDIVVAERTMELRPRRLDDPRWSWRVADVSAASHPTVAAAIARLSGARPDDVVWDPFCGSGVELIERALRGKAARILGSDLDSRALEAARQNLAAAGVTADLALADALAFDPGPVSLIITNPPLGRRLRGDPAPLLEQFVARAARLLVPRGRLVWITPVPDRTGPAARRAGLRLDHHRAVDLGGYDAELERWVLH